MREINFKDLFLMNWYEYEDLLRKNNGGFIKVNGIKRLNENFPSENLKRKLRASYELIGLNKNHKNLSILEMPGAKIAYGGAYEGSFVHGQDVNAGKYLKLNRVYTVKTAVAHEYVTYIELEEVPGIIFYPNPFIRQMDILTSWKN